jgi:hypothetical protein
MKRAMPVPRLHMGCGEGLNGRVPAQVRRDTAPRQAQGARQVRRKTGKDRQ